MGVMDYENQLNGRLVSLHWPKEAAGATLSFDTSQLQGVKAEIEDSEGVTHLIDVVVSWDADYLVGKDVSASTTDDGITLKEK
jgi:hypothetical protein